MKIKSFAMLSFLFIVNTVSAQSIFEKWPTLKTFHEVMSQTFHPVEEGDFGPLKSRSLELFQKAEALLKNDIPEEYRTNAILSAAERLQLKSKSLHKLVLAKASDEDLVKSLTELHNIFHEIVGLCYEEKN